jgi:hypothetical protein
VPPSSASLLALSSNKGLVNSALFQCIFCPDTVVFCTLAGLLSLSSTKGLPEELLLGLGEAAFCISPL